MTSDTTRKTATDVPFKPAGPGLAITRQCGARVGQWLCGTRISFRGICGPCATARDERRARAA